MLLTIFRGITRSNYSMNRAICLQRYYSDKKSDGEDKKSNVKSSHDDKTKSMTQQKIDELKTRIHEKQVDAEKYVFARFLEYMKNYDQIVAKKYPTAFKVYRVYMDGVKNCYNDMKDYLKIQGKLFGEPERIQTLTRKELEIYYHLPQDLRKVAPFIIISALPMVQYVTMPLAYMYPRRLLSYQFWTLQQRCEFSVLNLQDRLAYNRKVLRFLQAKLPQVKNDPNYAQLRAVFGKLGSGLHPSVEEIVAVKKTFAETPYKTGSLTRSHIVSLCGLHGLNLWFFKRSKLTNRAMMMHLMDMAIVKEGGPANMTSEELRFCCYMRGLNASNLSNEELIKWLEQWIAVSKEITAENFSLYLHLPIFLTYNHPNNWKLIYRDR